MTSDTQNLVHLGNVVMLQQDTEPWGLAWRGSSLADPFRLQPQERPRMPTIAEARAHYLRTRRRV